MEIDACFSTLAICSVLVKIKTLKSLGKIGGVLLPDYARQQFPSMLEPLPFFALPRRMNAQPESLRQLIKLNRLQMFWFPAWWQSIKYLIY